MADRGHELTDSLIEDLEKKIEKEYQQATKEVQEKWQKYVDRFAVKERKKRQQVLDGTLSQQKFDEWRYGQICVGERWREMRDTLAQDLVNHDTIARSIIGDFMPEAYAVNHNFATYQVEHDALIDTSYTLYNRRTVENLLKDNPTLLPYPRSESKTAKRLRERADLIWNRQQVSSAITQGVLQGESIPKITKRLLNVTEKDKVAAVRNARTMMTGCQNKGRQDAYDALKEKGIEIAEMWVATLDSRTRHTHRHLHGTYKDPKTGEYENGLEYPGDPMGDPAEVYNCRCTEIAEVEGVHIDIPKYSPKMKDMTFDEWLNAKGTKDQLWWNRQREQDQPHRMTVYDVGARPERPRRADYVHPTADDPYAGYEEFEKARDAYKEEREAWEERRDQFVKESLPEKSMTVAEMKDWCKNHNATVYGDISPVDGRALTVVTERMEQLFDEFPMVQDYFGRYNKQYEFDFQLNSDYLAEASNGFSFGRNWKDLEYVLQFDIAEHQQSLIHLLWVEHGNILLDVAFLFQAFLTFEYGCWGQMNCFSQLFCGQFCVFLQRFQYLQVGFVEDFSHHLEFYSV